MNSEKSQPAKDGQVIGVIKVRVDAAEAAALLERCVEVLAAESQDLPGFEAAQILVSVDGKTMIVLTEWSDHHAWSKARYDVRVGEMTELLYSKSATIEFETYRRRASFAPPSPAST